MNAKEMFEELGYEKEENGFIYRKDKFVVAFNTYRKTHICCEEKMFGALSPVNTTLATSKAIIQQMKELGWIE